MIGTKNNFRYFSFNFFIWFIVSDLVLWNREDAEKAEDWENAVRNSAFLGRILTFGKDWKTGRPGILDMLLGMCIFLVV